MQVVDNMLPLSAWPEQARHKLIGVFTDIDDTLTTEGAITPDALQALADLKAAGLVVIAITGRPIGWCAPFALGDAAQGIARWPVDAMVAENGALAFAPALTPDAALEFTSTKGISRNRDRRKLLSKLYQQDASTRAVNYTHMQQVAAQVLREVLGATLSQDSAGRETDIAIDHSEFARMSQAQITQVVALMHAAGMHATVSSIHINGWFGEHNKWQGACWIVQKLFGRDLRAELNQWAFVGDSTNDQLMFEHFPHSVGVANVQRFVAQLAHLPRYITPSERGAGFAQVARSILAART
jgi:HAD superfamily hydrolase (TIGR01484 family)